MKPVVRADGGRRGSGLVGYKRPGRTACRAQAAEFEKRRQSDRMGDTDEEESAASQQEAEPAG
jgi:hypothetical protein